MIPVPRERLQAVFDLAVNSMDFGSGFLEFDDAKHLRAIAELLGVDVQIATPDNVLMHFPHSYYNPWKDTYPDGPCHRCKGVKGNVIHLPQTTQPEKS